jgi:hypothetical protein
VLGYRSAHFFGVAIRWDGTCQPCWDYWC